MPRTTTSSTWRRTQAAIAVSGAPASPARSASLRTADPPPHDAEGDSPGAGSSSAVSLSDRLEYLGYRGLVALVGQMRHRHAGALGRAVARAAWLTSKRRALTIRNLALAMPELSADERRAVAKRAFLNFGTFFLAQLSAARYPVEEFAARFEITGREHLARAREAHRGMLLMTGHLGPFDIGSYPIGQLLGRVETVARPPSNPLLIDSFREVRERTGMVLVPSKRVAQRLFFVLRHDGAAALAIDQKVRPSSGILVDFLGAPAWTSPVPALLSMRTGAPVVPIFCLEIGAGRYRIDIDPPIFPETFTDDPEAELTRRYLEPAERRIRQTPDQWMWMHRRWQRVFPHRDRRFRERARRESGLTELAGPPPGGRRLERTLRTVWDGSLLEASRHVMLGGDHEMVRRTARWILDRALDRGFSSRWDNAPERARLLVEAQRAGRLGAELRALDRCTPLWLDGLAEVPAGAPREVLARLIERRQRLGTMLLEAAGPEAPRAGDPLGAALERVRARPDNLQVVTTG